MTVEVPYSPNLALPVTEAEFRRWISEELNRISTSMTRLAGRWSGDRGGLFNVATSSIHIAGAVGAWGIVNAFGSPIAETEDLVNNTGAGTVSVDHEGLYRVSYVGYVTPIGGALSLGFGVNGMDPATGGRPYTVTGSGAGNVGHEEMVHLQAGDALSLMVKLASTATPNWTHAGAVFLVVPVELF